MNSNKGIAPPLRAQEPTSGARGIPVATRVLRQLLAASIAATLVFAGFAPQAEGHYFCQVWPYSPTLLTLPVWDQVNRSLYPEFSESISAWNSSPTAAWFTSGSQSNYLVNAVDAYYGNTGWDGYGLVHGLCGQGTDAAALLNDSTLPAQSYSNKRYVETHELGHTLTLDHADALASVMNSTTASYWTIQQHDIDDMNARYPR